MLVNRLSLLLEVDVSSGSGRAGTGNSVHVILWILVALDPTLRDLEDDLCSAASWAPATQPFASAVWKYSSVVRLQPMIKGEGNSKDRDCREGRAGRHKRVCV